MPDAPKLKVASLKKLPLSLPPIRSVMDAVKCTKHGKLSAVKTRKLEDVTVNLAELLRRKQEVRDGQ